MVPGLHFLIFLYLSMASPTTCTNEAATHDMDESSYRQVLQSPHDGMDRCSCPTLDIETVLSKGAASITEPTILTKVLQDWETDAPQRWTRSDIVRHSGHVNFSDSDLNHNGAGVYMSKNKSRSESTLAQLLSVQQPGNLFVDISVRDIQNVLLPNRSALPPRIKQLMLQTIPAPLRRGPFISLGSKGQWNHMHIHAMTIFTQVKGSKGWVIAPADTFPEGKARMKQSHGFAGRHIADVQHRHVCGQFFPGSLHQYVHSGQERSAAQNLTKYGHCCVVKEGEGFFMPGYSDITGWWHGTCNLDHWNAGFAHIR